MRLSWHHGFLNPRDGEVEIPASRAAVAEAIGRILPALAPVSVDHVSFVPVAPGRAQVNLHMFGPFGLVVRGAEDPPSRAFSYMD
jgi:hypothetical protein